MFRVVVETTATAVKQGTSTKTGKPYRIVEQDAHVFLRDGNTGKECTYPSSFRLRLEDGQDAYSPGEYVIDSASVYVGRYGELLFGRVKLVRRAAMASKAAA
jgi:hypothetical protein